MSKAGHPEHGNQSTSQVNWLLRLIRRCRAGRMGRVREPGGVGCGIPAYDRVVILRCTSKLLAVIGPALAAKPAPAPDAEDWYANLLWFDRRKCLLLTHAATLFSIFEADVSAADLRATSRLITRLLGRELRGEGCHRPRSPTWSQKRSSSPQRPTAVSLGA